MSVQEKGASPTRRNKRAKANGTGIEVRWRNSHPPVLVESGLLWSDIKMASSSSASIVDRAPGSTVLDMIGRTPLVRLQQFEREIPAGVELYAKAEWQNPGGSVKDRAAARMVLDGEASGRLRPGKIILDATSGNTGIAYAMVGAARGYKVRLCVPENASPERKLILRALGAELVLTNPLESTDGAIREARRLYAEDSERYFYPDQYNNDANC